MLEWRGGLAVEGGQGWLAAAFAAERELMVVESAGEFGLFELGCNVLIGHLVLSGLYQICFLRCYH